MHTLEQLTAFITVYEQGSYSTAAKVLNKSRTTIREHVMAYEDLLGYPLFVIEGRKAVPTDMAHQLYLHAKIVVKQNRDLHLQSQALFDSDIHTVNIVYDVIAPLDLLTYIERQVKKHYPALIINWQHRTRQTTLDMLSDGTADLAIMPPRGSLFPEKEVAWKSLGNIEVGCFSRKGSSLSKEKSLTFNHLRTETQYITENLMLNVSFAKVSPKLHTVSNSDLLCELLKYDGWAAMPKHYMEPHVKAGDIVELTLDEVGSGHPIGLNVFYPHGKDNIEVYKRILKWCFEYGLKYL